MKRSAFRIRKLRESPIARCETNYAALAANAEDTDDDRISVRIFDIEDERAEVGVIVHGMIHGEN